MFLFRAKSWHITTSPCIGNFVPRNRKQVSNQTIFFSKLLCNWKNFNFLNVGNVKKYTNKNDCFWVDDKVILSVGDRYKYFVGNHVILHPTWSIIFKDLPIVCIICQLFMGTNYPWSPNEVFSANFMNEVVYKYQIAVVFTIGYGFNLYYCVDNLSHSSIIKNI